MIFSTLEIRLIGALVAVILLFGIGVYLEHRGVEKCQMDDAKVAAIQTAAAKEQEAQDASRVKDAEDQYHDELTKNLQPVAVPEPVVRLCVSPRPKSLPQASTHPSGPPSAPTATGPLPPVAGPDIGPKLYAEADRADKIAAQLRALELACSPTH